MCVSDLAGGVCSLGAVWFQAAGGVVCCLFLVYCPVCWGPSGGCAVFFWLVDFAGAFAGVVVGGACGGVSFSPDVLWVLCSWGYHDFRVGVPGIQYVWLVHVGVLGMCCVPQVAGMGCTSVCALYSGGLPVLYVAPVHA